MTQDTFASSSASSSTERPLFRYDLQTTAIQESGHRYVDVTDPNGGKSFRFYEVEYAVACGMDGQRDVAAIVRWAMLELELQTTPAEVSAIVAKLAELEYIDVGAQAGAITAADDSGFELGSSGKSAVSTARPAPPAVASDVELGLAGRSDTVAEPKKESIDSEFELGLAGNEGIDDAAEAAAPAEIAATAELAAVQEAKAAEVAATEAAKTAAAAAASAAKAAAAVAAETAAAAAAAAAEEKKASAAAALVITPDDLPIDVAAGLAIAEEATPELVAESSDISNSIAEEATATAKSGGDAIALADSDENQAKREAAEKKADALAKKSKDRRPLVRRSASIVLWLLLLGAVAGAAYYYFFHTPYVLEHPADQPLHLNQTPQRAKAKPKPKPELAAPSTLTVTEIPTADALAVRSGVVEWVSDPGSDVSEGDTILKIRGSSRLQAAVDKETNALEVYQAQLETAEARDDEAKRAVVEADIARKQGDLDAANAKLAPFVVRAPISGTVEVLVKARDRVKAEQAIGRITGVAKSIVVFNLSGEVFAEEGQEFQIETVEDSELTATCIVAATNEQEITLECPSDLGIKADTAVKLSVD